MGDSKTRMNWFVSTVHVPLGVLTILVAVALGLAIWALTKDADLGDHDVKRSHIADNAVGPDQLDEAGDYTMNDLALNGTLNRYKRKTETLVATVAGTLAAPSKTLTAADSGTIFHIDATTYVNVVTLPALQDGLEFDFVVKAVGVDFVVYTGSGTVYMKGSPLCASAPVVFATATVAQLDHSVGNATIGDRLHFECDGTYWYISGTVLITQCLEANTAITA